MSAMCMGSFQNSSRLESINMNHQISDCFLKSGSLWLGPYLTVYHSPNIISQTARNFQSELLGWSQTTIEPQSEMLIITKQRAHAGTGTSLKRIASKCNSAYSSSFSRYMKFYLLNGQLPIAARQHPKAWMPPPHHTFQPAHIDPEINFNSFINSICSCLEKGQSIPIRKSGSEPGLH